MKLKYKNMVSEFITIGIFIVIALIGYTFFCHEDVLVTANHSYVYLEGHFRSFYSLCQKMNGQYSANYMPTTFWIFAIWNIPLKMLGLGPQYWGDWRPIFVFWNKLLPVLFFLASVYLLYKIARDRFECDEKKSRVIAAVYCMSPVAFYSQLLFCQYDSFTVLLILLGMYFYFDDSMSQKAFLKFIASFCIAITLKYQAILIFLVLLLLKIKDIRRIIISSIGVVSLFAIEFLVYFIYDAAAFKKAVFGFSVLKYANLSQISVGNVSLQLVPFLLCVLIAWVYFTDVKDKTENICYALFFCNGIMFVMFTFMKWHPQWILLAVPFWSISICINRKYNILLWVELILSAAFVFWVVLAFSNNADQNLLRFGALSSELRYSMAPSIQMKDILRYTDKNMIFSVLAAIFFVYFIFSHPKYMMANLSDSISGIKHLVRFRYLLGTLLFMIPAFMCVPSMLDAKETLWSQPLYTKEKETLVDDNVEIIQYATVPGQCIDEVEVYTIIKDEKKLEKSNQLLLKVYDTATGEIVAQSAISAEDLNEDGYSTFTLENCDIEDGKQYAFAFTMKLENESVYLKYGSHKQNRVIELEHVVQRDYSQDYISINGERMENKHIISGITGIYS